MLTPCYRIVIPARYDSVRLPGKALADIGGRPMIQHVWEAGRRSAAEQVVVATDDLRILEVVQGFGGESVLTSVAHQSGSDRIAEAATILSWPASQLIVNLQGDEPEMPPRCLDQVAALLADDADADAATLYWPISEAGEVIDPNVVKVTVKDSGDALCFSRSPIPHARGYNDAAAALAAGIVYRRHLGLYAYRFSALARFTAEPPSELELTEKLEQLRILQRGGRIRIAQACSAIPPGIDTPADLEAARARWQQKTSSCDND